MSKKTKEMHKKVTKNTKQFVIIAIICLFLKMQIWHNVFLYRVFHGFGQAKFPYGGSVFRLEPIYTTAPAAS